MRDTARAAERHNQQGDDSDGTNWTNTASDQPHELVKRMGWGLSRSPLASYSYPAITRPSPTTGPPAGRQGGRGDGTHCPLLNRDSGAGTRDLPPMFGSFMADKEISILAWRSHRNPCRLDGSRRSPSTTPRTSFVSMSDPQTSVLSPHASCRREFVEFLPSSHLSLILAHRWLQGRGHWEYLHLPLSPSHSHIANLRICSPPAAVSEGRS